MKAPKIDERILKEMTLFFSKTSHPRIVAELKEQGKKIS